MAEYLKCRCCLCPNSTKENQQNTICPGIEGSLHPNPSVCCFVKSYVDEKGRKYKVMSGIGEGAFKARRQDVEKNGMVGWRGVRSVPWRTDFDLAQMDLNILAEKKKWKEVSCEK